METQQQNAQQTIIVKSEKSMGITIILSILFGPLGMLYSTISGAVVMFLISVPVAFFTLGFGLFFTWPICVIWAAVATSNYNKKLGTR